MVFVDTSSGDDPSAMVSSVLPEAFIIREPTNPGFSKACNIGAKADRHATHYLFCHDDIAFEPDSIRKMVEEAFLMNAGVVTPKYVVWNSPHQILALGAQMDRTGTVATRVDVGDRDQGQYDVSEEVFVAPGGATLVRRDLFEAIGGFDERMFLYYEDVDLSWRAKIAGARIAVAPLSRVRHLLVTTLGARRSRGGRNRRGEQFRSRLPRHERLHFARQNQLRALMSNVRGGSRVLSILQYLVISVVEAAYFFATGKPKIAISILESWVTMLTRRGSIRKKRNSILHYRVKSDSALRMEMVRGSARVKAFINTRKNFRAQNEAGPLVSGWRDYRMEKSFMERLKAPAMKSSRRADNFDDNEPLTIALGRISRVFMWIMVAFVIVATRHVTTGPLPLYGQLMPYGPAHTLIANYFSGSAHHHGPVPPSPTVDLLLGVLGYIFLGGTGTEAHFVIAALIAAGLAGVFRLLSDYRNGTAAYLGTALYAAGPVLGGVISGGSLGGLAVYGMAPWMLLRILRLANFPGTFRPPKLSTRYEVVVEGIWLALILAFAPSFLIVFALAVVTFMLLGKVLGYLGPLRRFAAVQISALGVALLLNSPWIFSFFNPQSKSSAFFGSDGPVHVNASSLFLLQSTPLFSVNSVFGFYLVAVLATLFFVRGPKADRVLTLLGLFSVMEVLEIASSSGALGPQTISTELVVPVAFIAAVLVIGSGIEAAIASLPGVKVGWHHLALVLGGISLLLSSVSMLGSITSGRYGLVSQGYEDSLGWMVPYSKANPGKVLWLGRPGALPMGSYSLGRDITANVVELGIPTVSHMFAPAAVGSMSKVLSIVRSASDEDTVYMGHELAQMRIKYVVIPQSSISNYSFLTSDLNLLLSRQRDLNQLVADPSIVSFSVQNALARTPVSHLDAAESILGFLRVLTAVVVALMWAALLEATLSRRSIALWMVRRFSLSGPGRAVLLAGAFARKMREPRGSAAAGVQNEPGSAVCSAPELPQTAGGDPIAVSDFKHVRITQRVGEVSEIDEAKVQGANDKS